LVLDALVGALYARLVLNTLLVAFHARLVLDALVVALHARLVLDALLGCWGLFHHPLPLVKGFVLKSNASSSTRRDGVHHLLLLEKIYPQIYRFDLR